MSKERIFLTGGTGLVGTALTSVFSINGLIVKAIYRERRPEVKNISWINTDLLDPDINLYACLENVDVIVHNAASIKVGRTQAEIEELKQLNIDFTKKLLKAASHFNIKKIIFTSSFSLIRKPLPGLIDEESPIEITTAYAESKYVGEQLLQEYAAKQNIAYNICRISSPVSFNFSQLPDTVIKKWITLSRHNENIKVFGNGGRSQDFVAVSDIANAYLNCVKNEISGIFNIASGNTISMLALAKLIASYFNNDFEFVHKDVDEYDRWNISIEKAKKGLNYKPDYSSTTVIETLLKHIKG